MKARGWRQTLMGWAARANTGGKARRATFVPYKVSAAASMKIAEMLEPDGTSTYDALLQGIVQDFWQIAKMDRRTAPRAEATGIGVLRRGEDAASLAYRLNKGCGSSAPLMLLVAKFPNGTNGARFVTTGEFEALSRGKTNEHDIYWTMPPRQSASPMPEHTTVQ